MPDTMTTTWNDRGANGMTRREAMVDLRSTLAWLGDDVKYINAEVDPVVEMITITKAFDNSKVFVANNIKGFPGVRMIANLYSRKERVSRFHGVTDFRQIKNRILHNIANPIPPRVVSDAPVQEVTLIPGKDFEHLHDIIPVATHTFQDGGPIFGAGSHLFMGEPWVPGGGSQISMYRMSFRRDQKLASINMVPGGAGDVICSRHPGKKVPCTINICPPVGPELVAVSTLNPVIFPNQTDKLGLAGAIQGFPVDIVKAKTIDAYAMANAEWVLEGYVLEGERMWETLEAEQSARQGVSLLHPEWTRTMGHAYRTPRSFELTAVTRRKKDMIVYTPHFGSYWFTAPFICASVYELCERMAPGFVKDVANWLGLTFWGGVVVQVKKRRRSDEGLQRNLMTAIMGLNRGMRMVIMVDDDIDPWQPEDVMWAIQSRASATKDYIVYNEYSRGQAFQPSEHKIGNISVSDGGIGIDATAPLGVQVYERSRYPVDQMDFSKWFSPQEIAELKGMQDPYYGWLGETGYG
jgi:3-polyprenyl-4-hydroxybenzoate decarboxylase